MSRHEVERYQILRHVETDAGRGKAWLRSALNEHCLERYTNILLSDARFLINYYEPWSLVLDDERRDMLPQIAAGLGSILFALTVDSSEHDGGATDCAGDITPSVVVNTSGGQKLTSQYGDGDSSSRTVRRKKKKKAPRIVDIVDAAGSSCELAADNDESHTDLPVSVELPRVAGGMDETSEDTVSPSYSIEQASEDRGSTSAFIPTIPMRPPSLTGLPFAKSASSPALVPSGGGVSVQQRVMPGRENIDEADEDLCAAMAMLSPIDSGVGGPPMFLTPTRDQDDVRSETASAVSDILSMSSSQPKTHHYPPPSSPDMVTTGEGMDAPELRQALVILQMKKEELNEQNMSLRQLLNSEMELSAGLRKEIERLENAVDDKQERTSIKIQNLTRENELLKHQLKKYVAAVQLLSRQQEAGSGSGTGPMGIEEGEKASDRGHRTSVPPDYSHEAKEYERKLVQVAEMHGELLEFNEYLRVKLNQKETQLQRIRDELVELRGPLPDDVCISDDDAVSITSDLDQSNLVRPLINLWIPSTFLQKLSASDSHHVYQIYVRIRDEEWNIYRRYSEFYEYHSAIKKQYPIISTFDFPPKKSIGNKDIKVVENRRLRLQHYLRSVTNVLIQNNAELSCTVNKETFTGLYPFFSEYSHQTKKVGVFSRRRKTSRQQLSSRPLSVPSQSQQQVGRVSSSLPPEQSLIYDGH